MTVKRIKRGVRIENVPWHWWSRARSWNWRRYGLGFIACRPFVDAAGSGNGFILEIVRA